MLSRLGRVIGFKARLQLANALIVSKFAYAISIWGHTSETYRKKAQCTLNLAARFVSKLNKRTKTDELMKACNWMSIAQLTAHSSLLILWKTINWNIPHFLNELISVDSNLNITTTIPRLLIVENSFRWEAVRIWNLLPQSLKEEKRIGKFKSGVKTWLVEGGLDEDNDAQLG